MVFPSVPIFLDPHNWNQQQQQHQAQFEEEAKNAPVRVRNPAQPPPGVSSLPHPDVGAPGTGTRTTPPGSMAERARMAKIPHPEPSLKCPRCSSTNTKFCYFNNYSLSQPRHFCKSCRRYWTRGGALRNVPVGGGCRRNKRNKSSSNAAGSSSKSSSTTGGGGAHSGSATTTILPNGAISSSVVPFMSTAALHPLPDYMTAPRPSLGLGFGGIDAEYQGSGTSGVGLEDLRQQIHHFPFLGGIDSAQQLLSQPQFSGLLPFGGGDVGGSFSGQVSMRTSGNSVKAEENVQGINIARNQQLLGVQQSDHFLAGGGWVGDFTGFSSSSTGNNQLM